MRKAIWAIAPFLFLATACNVFDPFQSPGTDAQYLSAARACFDRGDMVCAREMYGKVSVGSTETAAAETAFTILDEQGAGMAAFAAAVGDGNGAAGLNKLAGTLSTLSPGVNKRNAMLTAYQYINQISSNASLRGFVRFVAGFSLAAEILAEDAGGDGTFSTADLTAHPTTCSTSLVACTTGDSNCAGPSGATITHGGTINLSTASNLNGSPTVQMIDAALKAVQNALDNEIQATGKFNSGTSSFISQLTTPANTAADEQCYRQLLLTNGVGI